MLNAQGVVDLSLELGVRVGFVKYDNGSVKAQVWPPHTGEANALPRARRQCLADYETLTSRAFDLAFVVVGR
jgi:hypothetical protein